MIQWNSKRSCYNNEVSEDKVASDGRFVGYELCFIDVKSTNVESLDDFAQKNSKSNAHLTRCSRLE